MHSGICLEDTDKLHREGPLACRVILARGPRAAFKDSSQLSGTAPRRLRDSVTLTYPCQHAAAHLACTRPPDFVVSRRSFTVFVPAPSSSSTRSATLLDGRSSQDVTWPPKDSSTLAVSDFLTSPALGCIESIRGIVLSAFLLICLIDRDPCTRRTASSPSGYIFCSVFVISTLHVCSCTQPHSWERSASVCIIHLCSVFARLPHPFS